MTTLVTLPTLPRFLWSIVRFLEWHGLTVSVANPPVPYNSPIASNLPRRFAPKIKQLRRYGFQVV
jgi:hypothetical protein